MRNPSVGWRGKPLLGAVPSIALPAAHPTMANVHVRGNNDCNTHNTNWGSSLVKDASFGNRRESGMGKDTNLRVTCVSSEVLSQQHVKERHSRYTGSRPSTTTTTCARCRMGLVSLVDLLVISAVPFKVQVRNLSQGLASLTLSEATAKQYRAIGARQFPLWNPLSLSPPPPPTNKTRMGLQPTSCHSAPIPRTFECRRDSGSSTSGNRMWRRNVVCTAG